MRLLPRNRNLIAVLHDSIMAAASFLLALYLRLGDAFPMAPYSKVALGAGLFTAVCILVSLAMRHYRGLWRYASMQDLIIITKAVTLSVLIFYPLLFTLTRLEGVPRSVPFIHWLLLLFMLGAPRFAYRMVKDKRLGFDFTLRNSQRIPVLLVGSGDEAEIFLRESSHNPSSPYQVVGIVDRNRLRIGRSIHGIAILGDPDTIPAVAEKLAARGQRPQRLILTDPHMPGASVRQLLEAGESLGIPVSRLPRLTELKSGEGERLEVKPIAVEDLLGRAQNTRDKGAMQAMIAGKTVAVTGAGGTIGSELVRQIASFGPGRILLIELSEYNLYRIDGELARDYPVVEKQALICDVRDAAHISHVLMGEKPEILFHTAAIKHVPIAEANPEEAALTNVFGTRNVADACLRAGVATMVLISTDKAVNPTNVMGATKRIAESYCQALGSDPKAVKGTKFVTVRFGNVLGSTGSVVPLFQQQLAWGGPLTVTHPEMVRYFMTVREAVELVLQAATLGSSMEERNGLIFVLDMGQAVRIQDLAEQMIKLAGLRPNVDIRIEYTGLRPGEKLFEELFHFSENSVPTEQEGLMLASPRPVQLKAIRAMLADLETACEKRGSSEVLRILKLLVPEFKQAA